MVRGVNKLIIEVSNPESDYFERAIFFVKPNKSGAESPSTADIHRNAREIMNSAAKAPLKSGGKLNAAIIAGWAAAALLGGLAATGIMVFLM
ncbi:MAG: hypothetical protein FWH20_01710 [Oscillospiraceae bacterium]|nr:hypothetical protein [Oscillospiraceae bacterium]